MELDIWEFSGEARPFSSIVQTSSAFEGVAYSCTSEGIHRVGIVLGAWRDCSMRLGEISSLTLRAANLP